MPSSPLDNLARIGEHAPRATARPVKWNTPDTIDVLDFWKKPIEVKRLRADQSEPLLLKNGRFCLRRDIADRGDVEAARTIFRGYYIQQGRERLQRRVDHYAPKVGIEPTFVDVRDLGDPWASCLAKGNLAFTGAA